jgi:signal transduction histidine kinase
MHSAQPIGESAAHFVNEVKQPLIAILTNAETALIWMIRDPVNLEEAKRAIERIIGDCQRVADVGPERSGTGPAIPACDGQARHQRRHHGLARIRDYRSARHDIAVETELAENLDLVAGDHGQLGRVLANLIANSIKKR